MDTMTAAREIAERLRPDVEHGNMRSHAEAERTLRYGQAQILLRKAERLSYILGDDRASSLEFEADVERLRADKAKLSKRDRRGTVRGSGTFLTPAPGEAVGDLAERRPSPPTRELT